jgi:hypothetical protein
MMVGFSKYIIEIRSEKSNVRHCFHVRNSKSFKIAQTGAFPPGESEIACLLDTGQQLLLSGSCPFFHFLITLLLMLLKSNV